MRLLPQDRRDDVALVERRVHPGDQHPGGAAAFRGDQGVGDEPVSALGAVGLPTTEPGAREQRAGARGANDPEQRVQALHAGVAATGAFLGVAEGLFHGVVDIDVSQLARAGQQRSCLAQVDQQPGRDRVELPDMPERERPQERPSVEGTRTPPNRRSIAPCRSKAMSLIESAPAIMPATSAGTFTSAPEPPGLPIRTCSAARSCNPARSASCSTGTRPAHDTRFGSSKTAAKA